jgi:hypothetical protein
MLENLAQGGGGMSGNVNSNPISVGGGSASGSSPVSAVNSSSFTTASSIHHQITTSQQIVNSPTPQLLSSPSSSGNSPIAVNVVSSEQNNATLSTTQSLQSSSALSSPAHVTPTSSDSVITVPVNFHTSPPIAMPKQISILQPLSSHMVSSLQSAPHSGVSDGGVGGGGGGVVGNGPVHSPTSGIPIPALPKGRFPGFPISQGQPSGIGHKPNPYHQGIQQVCCILKMNTFFFYFWFVFFFVVFLC